uniref:YtkA-like domain-containing protein n=1 Tax=Cyanothece sp. (strain PCC 7425 / ATCC 29141) TaxID=395961 RepID=B8HZN0_CYAP4
MNRLMNTLAIVTSLAIIQSCAQVPNAKEEPPITTITQQHSEHSVAETSHSHDSHGNTHSPPSPSTQATLTVPDKIRPNTPVSLQVDVKDQNGNALTQFDRFQEQIMHVIAVSQDLQIFQHLHPTYQGNGRFVVATHFPKSGNYTLFSDYQPAGQAEQVSVLKTKVDGDTPFVSQINWSRTKTFGQTIVSFAPAKVAIKAEEDVTLQFNLEDATTQQPITDLQPYLGEKGHLVILRQSKNLSRKDYIHAHAVQNTPANQVHFVTSFPQPGKYKLWGQFNRNGNIITADYWVEVIP